MAAGLSSDVVVGNSILAGDLNNIRSDAMKLVSVRTSTHTITNSTTFFTDTQMVFAIGSSSTEKYLCQMYLYIDAGVTPDFKFRIVVPSGAVIDGSWFEATTPVLFQESSVEVVNGLGSPILVTAHFIIEGGGTAGDIQLEWAQNTSDAAATRLIAGSCMLIAKLIA